MIVKVGSMHLELKRISIEDDLDIYEMFQEMPASENNFQNHVHGMSYPEYKEWLKDAIANSEQVGIVEGGRVPQIIYWLYKDGKPIGFSKVRLILTEALLKQGGNIGYGIRPSARGQGFGKKQLELILEECKKLALEKVLLTVNEDNKASQGVCLANGGRIEKIENGFCYIWVDLN